MVNLCSDVIENLRNILNLVEDGRGVDFFDERMGIGAETCNHVRAFKQIIGSLRKEFAKQGRLSRLPRTGEDQREKFFKTWNSSDSIRRWINFILSLLNRHFKKLKIKISSSKALTPSLMGIAFKVVLI